MLSYGAEYYPRGIEFQFHLAGTGLCTSTGLLIAVYMCV